VATSTWTAFPKHGMGQVVVSNWNSLGMAGSSHSGPLQQPVSQLVSFHFQV